MKPTTREEAKAQIKELEAHIAKLDQLYTLNDLRAAPGGVYRDTRDCAGHIVVIRNTNYDACGLKADNIIMYLSPTGRQPEPLNPYCWTSSTFILTDHVFKCGLNDAVTC